MQIEFELGLPSAEDLAAAPHDVVEGWAREVAAHARNGDDLTPAIATMADANVIFARMHGLDAPEDDLGR